MIYNGIKIEIIAETPNFITFTYDGITCCVNKALHTAWGEGDTRWLNVGSVTYDGIGFDVEDGHAVSNGILETYQYSDKEGFCMGEHTHENKNINDKIEIYFPTMREILSDARLFDEALFYLNDLGGCFEEYLNKDVTNDFNVGFFFEGFFFGGCTSPKYKISVTNNDITLTQSDAEKELDKCLEDDFIGDRIYEFAQDLFDGYVKKVEHGKTIVGMDGIPFDGEDGVEWYDDYRDEFYGKIYDAVRTFLTD